MQIHIAQDSPFHGIKVRSLVAWVLLGILPCGVIGSLMGRDNVMSRPVVAVFITVWPMFWILRQFRRHHIHFREFLGGMPQQKHWRVWILTVASLVSLSIGTVSLTWYPLSYIAPDLVENSFLPQLTFFSKEGVSRPLEAVFFEIACGTLLGPFVEEVCFRGVILHRWALRWGVRTSIVLSSLVFALLHADVLGAMAIGMVMCILHLRTRSLWVPIFCHALYNAIAFMIQGMNYLVNGPVKFTLEDFRSGVWMGVVFLAVGLPWAIFYLKKHWPAPDFHLPYIHAPAEPASASPAEQVG